MKQLKDFKKKIKEEPEMEIYEENTNKLIDKLKTVLIEIYKKYGKKFLNGKLARVTTIITSLTSIRYSHCYSIKFPFPGNWHY